MADPVYLDHAATTPVRPEVLAAMLPFFGATFGNPSSTHRWGREARAALDEARERVAVCLGAHPDEVCFTSGGTEADNFAVLGAWRARRAEGRHAVVVTSIEHKAVLGAAHQVVREGGEERAARVTRDGVVDEQSFDELTRDDVAICSVMWVNNEIGTVQPVPALAERAKARGALFHTDAVQGFGKVDIDARRTPFDLLSISGHKFGAPKGIGALFIRRGTPLEPLLHGGTQDRGRRPGTESVAFAVGLARACELAIAEHEAEGARLRELRDRLEARVMAAVPDAIVHGAAVTRAPHIASVSIPGMDGESLLMALDLRGIACSGGSACQSGSVGGSHVLAAMGANPELSGATVRLSLGALSTAEGVDRAVEVLSALVARARSMSAAS